MKRILLLLFFIISSFFLIDNVHAYMKDISGPLNNTFSIMKTGDYVVYHKQMNLDGETYTTIDQDTESGTGNIGETITPEVKHYTGFITPEVQTIEIDFGTTIISYLYERESYTLTIGNYEYVHTDTPSGNYLYGTQIHLTADPTDAEGHSFTKWSNGEVYPDIVFTMTEDTNIRPIYGNPYIVEFEPDGGTPAPASIEVYDGDEIGTLPVVKKEYCQSDTGTYAERNCTEVYKFEGWYTEPTFENKVNEHYVPQENIKLYAKWSKVYYHNDQTTFVGNNMLDSGIALFSAENADKDFIVTFTLDSQDANQGVGGQTRAALFANLDERAQPFAGTMIRWDKTKYEIVANVAPGSGMGKRKTNDITGFGVGQTFILTREGGKLYYSVDGGEHFTLYNDFSVFNYPFDATATFGGEYDANMHEYRYFQGTMSNMTVELTEPRTYTVKYDANGGTGMMLDQAIRLHETQNLTENAFTRHAHAFKNWNTEPDGSGTSYADKAAVSELAGLGEVVTLYAQWEETPIYYVAFDANGGVGSMENQEMPLNGSQKLNPSEFTKDGYIFDSWNTEPDGSGTRYEEGQSVSGLTSTPEDVVTLYAQYGKREYRHDGEIVFNGTSDYIDTQVNLYSGVNIDKDFIISFDIIDIDSVNGTNAGQEQPTILNAKDETYNANVVPGFAVRFDSNTPNPIAVPYKWGNKSSKTTIDRTTLPIHVEITRTSGSVKLRYSYDGGTTYTEETLYNQSSWTLDSNCPTNVTFGAIYKNNQWSRFFKGTLSNLYVHVDD